MILDLIVCVREGSKPAGTINQLLPTPYPIIWPRGEDGTLRLTTQKQDRAVYDLTGAALTFAVRRHSNDVSPHVSRQASIIDAVAGRADVVLVQADTLGLDDQYEYSFDVQLTDAAGRRWQVVPRSTFKIDPVIAQPAESVTVPPASSPLALGPSWLEVSEGPQMQTDLTTAEQLVLEGVWNFDEGSSPALARYFARLSAIARVSGGTGTVRVRYGGTVGQPDGTLLLTADPVSGTVDAVISKSATVGRPTGTQLVKVTLQNDTAGQRAFLRAISVRAHATV
jgi:hypothetical protein